MKSTKPSFEQLTGRDSSQITFLDNLSYTGMDKRVLPYWLKLQERASKDQIDLRICSGHRPLERQITIWNEKVEGKRLLLDRDENPLDPSTLSSETLLETILLWSAIPGFSRHHWGTDFDLYNHAAYSDGVQLRLTNQEYQSGRGASLTQWMDKNILGSNSDFYRPYQDQTGSGRFELWHYSFRPLSTGFEQAYTFDVFKKHLDTSDFHLKDLIAQSAKSYFTQGV
jgi:hypothetical protein